MAGALLKKAPIGIALYSVFAFAAAAPIAQIASASTNVPGIWVKLCATGTQTFIPLSRLKGEEEEPAMPGGSHSQACHACADRRFGDNGDEDNSET